MYMYICIIIIMYVFFQVKAAVLDPENNFNVERRLTKEDVRKIVHVRCVLSLSTCIPTQGVEGLVHVHVHDGVACFL